MLSMQVVPFIPTEKVTILDCNSLTKDHIIECLDTINFESDITWL